MRRFLPLALLLAGCPKSAPEAGPDAGLPEQGPPAPPPRLVVYVVVDQFPVRLLESVKPALNAGLGRLTSKDAYQAVGHYPYAITFTCPGHATLSTGAAPDKSGIPSNDWYLDGVSTYCGKIEFLRAQPLSDQVKASNGLVASLSLKDRGAIMLAGHSPDLLAWYDSKADNWAGTNVDALNAAVPMQPYYEKDWIPLRPDLYAQKWLDAQDWEGPPGGIGGIFPHPSMVSAGVDKTKAFRATPQAGDALADAAIAAVDQLGLGADETPDLLTVSFSQTDYIGHNFSVESWEAMDGVLRLDQSLGRLFDHLDAKIGAGKYSVVLSSDHGSAPAGAHRVPADAVQKAADAALAKAGMPTGVLVEDPGVWLPAELRDDPVKRAAATAVVAPAIDGIEGIARAYAFRDQPLPAVGTDPIADAVRLSLDDERSGDIYFVFEEGWLLDYIGAAGKGTSHGTPYDYDSHVPVLAFGPGIDPRIETESPDVRQIAPSIAELMRIPAPKDAELGSIPRMILPIGVQPRSPTVNAPE